jgi:4-hydroxybenzoate polyprenyltransferase
LPVLLHFLWQIWAWDMDNQDSSLKVFKSNIVLGVMVLAAYAFA